MEFDAARNPERGAMTALVVGGRRGLGLAIARELALSGYQVIVASRKLDACTEAARALERLSGSTCSAESVDVSRWASCDALVERIFRQHPTIDVLVNCAGMCPTYPNLTAVSEQLFDKVVATNLKGAFRIATLVGERMVARGSGAILNISSTAALHPGPSEIVYAGAKAALETMSTALAVAFAPEVRVNVLAPGPFATSTSSSWTQAQRDSVAEETLLRRLGVPSELVGAASC